MMWLALGGWGCDRPTLAQIAMKLNVQQLASNQIVPRPMLLIQSTAANIHKPALFLTFRVRNFLPIGFLSALTPP